MSGESKIKVESLEYQDVIEDAKNKVCERYNSGFRKKYKKAKNEERNEEVFAFRTLSMATSFTFNPEKVEEPFDAMMVMQGSRSAIPDDFSEDQLKLINRIIEEVNDPELKARLADIIWIRNRDFEKSQIAINSYLDSADYLRNAELYQAISRLERAVRLANSLGKAVRDLFDDSIIKIEAFIDKIEYENTFSTIRLMQLLIEFGRGDAAKYITLTKDLAKKAESNKDWRRARSCWQMNANWQSDVGDSDEERASLIKAADSFVAEAEASTSKMAAASFFQKAIEAHRRIGGQQERTKELHSKLLEIQKGIKDEMGSFSTDVDLSELVEHARTSIKEKNITDALFSLCLLVHPIKVEHLRERTQEMANNHPMQFIISGTLVDEKGKTIAEYPNMLTDSPEEREEALYAHMNREAHNDIQINVTGMINPARKQLMLEHGLRETDLHDLVKSNPIVPPGREYLFTRGLYEGFRGNFISATNILVTQFEHSMRYILNNYGIITSGLDDQRRQDDRSLNMTLAVDELEDVFGEDIAFTLRSLLINKFGGNLRNKVAHGLMHHHSYYSAEAIYFWGIILRLICWPGIVQAHEKNKNKSDPVIYNLEDQEE